MVIIICDDNQEDALLLQKMLRKKLAADETRPEYRYIEPVLRTSAQLLNYRFLENENYVLFLELVFENGGVDGIKLAEELRVASMNLLMVFTSRHLEFMPYLLRGSIIPAGFIKKPFRYPELCEIFDNTISLYEKQIVKSNCFVLNLSTETLRLPHSRILYFEALNKKINLHTISHRYSFYSSLTAIESEVGGCFVRCHNSFIINRDKVISVSLTDMIVTMENRAVLPISRTFKQNMRNVFADY